MSGHDNEFPPDHVTPFPPVLTSSTESAPMSPSSVESGQSPNSLDEPTPESDVATPLPSPSKPTPPAQHAPPRDEHPPPQALTATTPAPAEVAAVPVVTTPLVDGVPDGQPAAVTGDAETHPPPPTPARSLALSKRLTRFGSLNNSSSSARQPSVLRITTVHEASQAVADSKYRETLGVLEVYIFLNPNSFFLYPTYDYYYYFFQSVSQYVGVFLFVYLFCIFLLLVIK